MPRTNTRPIASEDALARRIAFERSRRDMTYEGLAKRMTDAGCAIQPSAIYKIEKAEPRRRITVDELVAFAEVFDLTLDNLLLPPEIAFSEEAQRLVKEWQAARREISDVIERHGDALVSLAEFSAQHQVPDMQPVLLAHLEDSRTEDETLVHAHLGVDSGITWTDRLARFELTLAVRRVER